MRQPLSRLLATLMAGLAWLAGPSVACDGKGELMALDQRYEQAILKADVTWLTENLDADFMWVHSRDSARETRSLLLQRLASKAYKPPVVREAEQHEVIHRGATWVVVGHSKVTKIDKSTDTPKYRTNTYLYMRTFIADKGRCKLLSSATSKIAVTDSAH